MGIDIYAKWRGMSKADKEKQYTGFATDAGKVGYLREAYHGEPYATQYLLKEAFDAETGEAKIPAKVLLRRLPKTLRLAAERNKLVYNQPKDSEDTEIIMQSFIDFVDLCIQKEEELGEPVTVIASY